MSKFVKTTKVKINDPRLNASLKKIVGAKTPFGYPGGVTYGSIVLIEGATDVGKSIFAWDLAYDFAAGRNLFGNLEVSNKQSVFLAFLEYSDTDNVKAIKGIKEYSGMSPYTIKTVDKSGNIDLLLPSSHSIFINNFYRELGKVAKKHKIIVIDNVNQLNVKKNSSDDAKTFLNNVLDIIRDKAVLFLVIHTGKLHRGEKTLTNCIHELKGASEWGDSARTSLNLHKVPSDSGVHSLTLTKKTSSISDKFENPVYLAYTYDKEKPYCLEVLYQPKKALYKKRQSVSVNNSYSNLGFEYLPLMTKPQIIDYIEHIKKEHKRLTGSELFPSNTDSKLIFKTLGKLGYIHIVKGDILSDIKEIVSDTRLDLLQKKIDKTGGSITDTNNRILYKLPEHQKLADDITMAKRYLLIKAISFDSNNSDDDDDKNDKSSIASQNLWMGKDLLSYWMECLSRLKPQSQISRPFPIVPFGIGWDNLLIAHKKRGDEI